MVILGNHVPATLPLLHVLCALRVEIPIPTLRTAPQESRALSPFGATLTCNSQLIENTMALSPAFATLTGNVSHKPFVCHSYKKQGGVSATVLPAQPFQLYRIPSRRSRRDRPSLRVQQRPQLHSFHALTLRFSGYPGWSPSGSLALLPKPTLRAVYGPAFPCAGNRPATSKCYSYRRSILGMSLCEWRPARVKTLGR
jgi:hypothetical protein